MEPKIRLKGFSGEWETHRIGELTSITTGATPSTTISSYWDNGTIRWMSSGELNNRHIYDVKGRITEEGYHSCGTHLIPPCCVLIGLAGQGKTRGTAAINHVELCTNQSIAALLPNARLFDSAYLYHYIDNKYLELRGMSTGDGGRGGLNKQILLDFEVKLPSMEEQRALASYFDYIDSLIQSTTKKIESLKQVKTASLQSMFPQEGETTPRVRFKGFDGEWEKVEFGSLITECLDKTTEEDEDVLLSSAIDGLYLNSELFTHFRGQSNKGYRKVKKNMLILSAQNLHLGNANVNLRFDHGIVSPAYKIYYIHDCNPELLSHWIKREETKKFFLDATTSGASVCRKNIVWQDLYRQTLYLPKEAKEQEMLANYLTNLSSLITLQTQRLEKLKQIKTACLDNMFV